MGIKGVKPGRITFVPLTLALKKKNPERYEFQKIKDWEHVLHQGIIPTKWLKPNKNGTVIHFKMFETSEERLKAIQELKEYVDEFNKTYNQTGSVEF